MLGSVVKVHLLKHKARGDARSSVYGLFCVNANFISECDGLWVMAKSVDRLPPKRLYGIGDRICGAIWANFASQKSLDAVGVNHFWFRGRLARRLPSLS